MQPFPPVLRLFLFSPFLSLSLPYSLSLAFSAASTLRCICYHSPFATEDSEAASGIVQE